MRVAARRALLSACLLALVACGSAATAPTPAAGAEGLFDFRGTVVDVDVPRRIVLVDHEAIPGLMPAMTMPYEVAEPALLDGIAPGDRVRGTLRVDSRGLVVVALVKG